MLVATDTDKAARRAADAGAPAVAGAVVLGGQSRIVIEPGDESVDVYYLLDIVNNARAPVNPPTPFAFDMPDGAVGHRDPQGSSPLASVDRHARDACRAVPAGPHVVQVAGDAAGRAAGRSTSRRRFPATLEQLAVIVKKVGDMKLTSPQLERAAGDDGRGRDRSSPRRAARLPPASRCQLTLTGLPHHSADAAVDRAGAGRSHRRRSASGRDAADATPTGAGAERKRLIARREKLLQELVAARARSPQRHASTTRPLRGAPRGARSRRSSTSTARSTPTTPAPSLPAAQASPRDGRVDFDRVELDRRLATLRPPPRAVARLARRSARRHPRPARPERRRQVDADRHARHARRADSGDDPLRRPPRAALGRPAMRGRIGLLAHELHLYPELTARQNLSSSRGSTASTPAALVDAALESRGPDRSRATMRSRVLARHAAAAGARARAAARPAAGAARRAVHRPRRSRGRASSPTGCGSSPPSGAIVVLATHDLDLADGLVTRVAVVRDGRLLSDEPRRPACAPALSRARRGDDG